MTVKQTVLGAAFVMVAGMAQAAITVDDVVSTYQAGDYSWVEIKEGASQIKVEALKNGVVIEVIYDKATGKILKSEQHAATAAEGSRSGIEVRTGDGRTQHSGVDDHGANHDLNDDHGGDRDRNDDSDDSDDDHGSGHDSNDDDGDDDHGSDHDSNDDDGDDDHGGDDSDDDDSDDDN